MADIVIGETVDSDGCVTVVKVEQVPLPGPDEPRFDVVLDVQCSHSGKRTWLGPQTARGLAALILVAVRRAEALDARARES